MRLPLPLLAVMLAPALPALGQELVAPEVRTQREAPASPRNYGNLRVGASTGNANGRPELCLELAPLTFLSVEGCGTGSGLLHADPLPEVAHFRGKLRLLSVETDLGAFHPLVSAGFAELQVGEDDAGFQFGGTDPRAVSTAGPELGLGLRYLRPLAGGFELVGDLNLGMAWLPHAPQLARPQGAWLPSASLSFGLGF